MQTSLVPARTFTLGVETPALSLRRDDPGAWTGGRVGAGVFIGSSCGVSAAVLSAWLGRTATAADMRAVTPGTMDAIYGADYWNRLNADALPAGLDCQVVDHGFNRGQATSALVLQRLVGQTDDGWIGTETVAAVHATTPMRLALHEMDPHALQEAVGVAQDGVVGPVTLGALHALPAPAALLAGLYAAQVRDYRGLAALAANPGWLVRARDRLAQARALSAA